MAKDLYIGIDVGSTTIKLVIMDESTNIIESSYNRHFSDTKRSIYNCLKQLLNTLTIIIRLLLQVQGL